MIATLAPELETCQPGRLAAARLPHLKAVIRTGAEKTSPACSTSTPSCGWPARAVPPPRRDHGDARPRRRHQHPVHLRHHRRAEGRHAEPLQHRQQRRPRRRARSLTEADRLCIPVPLYHCFGMVMGTLGCVTKGAAMVFPSEGFDPVTDARAPSGRALHGLLRRADHVRRHARPSRFQGPRPVVAAHRHHGRRALPDRGDEEGRVAMHMPRSPSPTA
jgi:fatty-acyl-CoA synthase